MEDLLKLINDFPLNSVVRDTTGNVGYVSGHQTTTHYSNSNSDISEVILGSPNMIRVWYLNDNYGWWLPDSINIIDKNTSITKGPPINDDDWLGGDCNAYPGPALR